MPRVFSVLCVVFCAKEKREGDFSDIEATVCLSMCRSIPFEEFNVTINSLNAFARFDSL